MNNQITQHLFKKPFLQIKTRLLMIKLCLLSNQKRSKAFSIKPWSNLQTQIILNLIKQNILIKMKTTIVAHQ